MRYDTKAHDTWSWQSEEKGGRENYERRGDLNAERQRERKRERARERAREREGGGVPSQ